MGNDNEELKAQMSALSYSYEVTAYSLQIRENYLSYDGKRVSVAGRVMAVRKAGKLLFADLQDRDGRIQAYFDYSKLGEEIFGGAKRLNPGDIAGVSGSVFKTKAGEPSINVESFALLSKAVINLPDKWHGVQDAETRYRKRYLDLIMNPQSKAVFEKRIKIIAEIRNFLAEKGFLEVETAVVQPVYGGADAQPFKTFVNTLGEEHYLRVSPELQLKRLIIGGFDKVFEFSRNFRNEDADTTHNPEFTSLEWYQAYADYTTMMALEEELLERLAKKITGSTDVTYQGVTLSFKRPFRRINFINSVKEKTGKNLLELGDEDLFEMAQSLGVKFTPGMRNRVHAYDKIFEEVMEKELVQPTFVLDFPRETSPLTRPKRGDPRLAERFDLYIFGKEVGPAYSELNNPFIQKENFESQEKLRIAGDVELPPADMAFVEAMEYGMPPAGGLGMGIDRLVMLLTDRASIKDVIFFPMERRGKSVLDKKKL